MVHQFVACMLDILQDNLASWSGGPVSYKRTGAVKGGNGLDPMMAVIRGSDSIALAVSASVSSVGGLL